MNCNVECIFNCGLWLERESSSLGAKLLCKTPTFSQVDTFLFSCCRVRHIRAAHQTFDWEKKRGTSQRARVSSGEFSHKISCSILSSRKSQKWFLSHVFSLCFGSLPYFECLLFVIYVIASSKNWHVHDRTSPQVRYLSSYKVDKARRAWRGHTRGVGRKAGRGQGRDKDPRHRAWLSQEGRFPPAIEGSTFQKHHVALILATTFYLFWNFSWLWKAGAVRLSKRHSGLWHCFMYFRGNVCQALLKTAWMLYGYLI